MTNWLIFAFLFVVGAIVGSFLKEVINEFKLLNFSRCLESLGTSYNAPVKEKVEKIKTMVFSLLKYSP